MNEFEGTTSDVTGANGVAAKFPIAGGGLLQVRVEVPAGYRLADGQSNPTTVRLGNGEYKVQVVVLLPT